MDDERSSVVLTIFDCWVDGGASQVVCQNLLGCCEDVAGILLCWQRLERQTGRRRASIPL